MECLLTYLCIVTVLHIMVGLERMLDYRCWIREVLLYENFSLRNPSEAS